MILCWTFTGRREKKTYRVVKSETTGGITAFCTCSNKIIHTTAAYQKKKKIYLTYQKTSSTPQHLTWFIQHKIFPFILVYRLCKSDCDAYKLEVMELIDIVVIAAVINFSYHCWRLCLFTDRLQKLFSVTCGAV